MEMPRILLLVLAHTILVSEAIVWDWRYWWTPEGWRLWQNGYRNIGLTKELLSDDIIPLTFLEVIYGGKKMYNTTVYPEDIVSPPDINWYCDKSKFYELMMLNPDDVAVTKGGQFMQWRVEGIKNCDFSTGRVTSVYIPPPLIPFTGIRRYFFLMFELDKYSNQLLGVVTKNSAFRVNDFQVEKYIKKNGRPFAGNYIVSVSKLFGDTNLVPFISELPSPEIVSTLNDVQDLVPTSV